MTARGVLIQIRNHSAQTVLSDGLRYIFQPLQHKRRQIRFDYRTNGQHPNIIGANAV
uniref:Uncharacterized protein n=1 Tax=Neisseria meningitidis alpha275 TaxID=295996 RepID=C6SGQ1_NEIME|nr:hypothetical protein predicted by Glimmer/Critica [Neisseria meningitidis alpha275]